MFVIYERTINIKDEGFDAHEFVHILVRIMKDGLWKDDANCIISSHCIIHCFLNCCIKASNRRRIVRESDVMLSKRLLNVGARDPVKFSAAM